MTPIWQRLGDRAIRFARRSGDPAAIVRAIFRWPHVVDVVVAHGDIAVYFDREPVDRFLDRHGRSSDARTHSPKVLRAPAETGPSTRASAGRVAPSATTDGAVAIDPNWIAALEGLTDDSTPVQEHTLRCIYDGPDLDAVARACDLTVSEVIARHSGATYIVETMGFMPGFGYLAGLDPRLELARRATPRPRVPGLSVAIAGRHTAVYPFDSPGGWHLIGRVPEQPMFGPAGARLALGDRVRFVP